jgi:hypothetical protein
VFFTQSYASWTCKTSLPQLEGGSVEDGNYFIL